MRVSFKYLSGCNRSRSPLVMFTAPVPGGRYTNNLKIGFVEVEFPTTESALTTPRGPPPVMGESDRPQRCRVGGLTVVKTFAGVDLNGQRRTPLCQLLPFPLACIRFNIHTNIIYILWHAPPYHWSWIHPSSLWQRRPWS